MTEETKHPFIAHLETLREDRAALAALRRGLGQDPGTVPAMYPYVVAWLPTSASRTTETAYYLIAAFFAYHPQENGVGNLGKAFLQVKEKKLKQNPNSDFKALERRFTTLLAAHPDDLPFYLRQAISYLKSEEIAIHWNTLFLDLQRWHYQDRRVQKQWATAFWGKKDAQ